MQQLLSWQMNLRDAIVPTSQTTKLYGQTTRIKIVTPEHEHVIYDNLDKMTISDSLYKELKEAQKMTPNQILSYIQNIYEGYLKGVKKQLRKLQGEWSRSFAQRRASIIIRELGFEDIYQVCDLVNERRVPIELILKRLFNKKCNYGDHRKLKDKSEITVDFRVLQVVKDLKHKNLPLSSSVRY